MKPVGSCHRCYRSVMQGERHDAADCRAALLETLERQKRDVRRTEANLREVGHTPAPTLALKSTAAPRFSSRVATLMFP